MTDNQWLSKLERKVLVYVPMCPTLMVRHYLLRAAVMVSEAAHSQKGKTQLRTLARVRDYPFDVPFWVDSAKPIAVYEEGRVVAWSKTRCGDIRLGYDPSQAGLSLEVEFEYSTPIKEGASTAEQDAVYWQAIFELLLIPQQRWSDPSRAQMALSMQRRAQAQVDQDHSLLMQSQQGQAMPRMRGARWL